jgi:hypothetical protein
MLFLFKNVIIPDSFDFPGYALGLAGLLHAGFLYEIHYI